MNRDWFDKHRGRFSPIVKHCWFLLINTLIQSQYAISQVGHWGRYTTKDCTKTPSTLMYIERNTTDMKEV